MAKNRRAADAPIRTDRHGFIRCRVCGCTEIDACENGCSWSKQDLCSTCASGAGAIADWFERTRGANWTRLWQAVEARQDEALRLAWEWVDLAHRPVKAAMRREVDRLFLRGRTRKAGGA
jgi:hypothetical protein